MEFVGRNGSDGVVPGFGRGVSRTMMLRSGSVQFSGFDPFYTLIPCKFEGEPLSPHNESHNIDEDVAVDGLPGEVEIFIGLDEKGRHWSG